MMTHRKGEKMGKKTRKEKSSKTAKNAITPIRKG